MYAGVPSRRTWRVSARFASGYARGRRFDALDDAEVQELHEVVDAPALADHDVLRLDVAMDHALVVDLGKRFAHLSHDVPQASERQCTVLRDQPVQRDAVDELHRVVQKAVRRLAVVVDLDGVRMRQLAHQPDLALEPRGELVGGHVTLEDLDRGRPLEQRVMREMNRGHAALGELAVEPVGADTAARRGLGGEPRQRQRRPRRPAGGGTSNARIAASVTRT